MEVIEEEQIKIRQDGCSFEYWQRRQLSQRKFCELDEGTDEGEERKGTYIQWTVTLSCLYLIGSIYLENPD